MVIKLGEFEDYIKTGELDLEKTNDLFAKFLAYWKSRRAVKKLLSWITLKKALWGALYHWLLKPTRNTR